MEDIEQLKTAIAQYSPDRHVPIIAGEWGYSPLVSETLHEDLQAAAIVRVFLTTFMADIPVTIWYDWRNDGIDPRDYGSDFGLVRYNSLDTKPSFDALQEMITRLKGMVFAKRIHVGAPGDFCLLFEH